MRSRLLLGPLMIALLVGVLWLDEYLERRGWDPGLAIGVVVLTIAVIGAGEMTRILRAKGVDAALWLMRLAALLGVGVMWQGPRLMVAGVPVEAISTMGMCVLALGMAWAVRGRTTAGASAVCGGGLLSFVYLGLMFGFVFALRREHGVWALLWVLLVIKACDIGAYFTGKAVGKHKLIPWLSPGKTKEGLAGGVVAAMAVATGGLVVYERALGEPLAPLWVGPVAGAVFAVLGQVGDLMASVFKRDAGLKDSGSVLPGFGGVLDVVDSPLLVVPVAYWGLRALSFAPGAVGSEGLGSP